MVWLLLLLGAICALEAGGEASPRGSRPRSISDPRHLDASEFGRPVSLGPNWLFMPGDNAGWASPDLDDSTWHVISSSRPIAVYGFHDLRYGWYRTHIRLRPGVRRLSVGVLNMHGSYAVYANGVQVGASGNLAGMVRYTKFGLDSYAISDGLLGADGQLVLAIRVAFNASGTLGRGTSTPIDSSSEILLIDERSALHEASDINIHSTADYVILAFLSLLVGVVALALFWAMRSRREYLAAGVALLASCFELCSMSRERIDASTLAVYVARYIFLAISNVASIEFIRMIVRQRRVLWLSILEAFSFVAPFFALLNILGYGSYYFAFGAFFVPMLVVEGVQVLLLARGSLQRNIEARVLLPAALLLGLARFWDFVSRILYFMRLTTSVYSVPELRIGSYRFDIFSIADFVFYVTVLLFLVLRTVSIARERARIGAELEAARTTQQFLMSRDEKAIPGFEVQSVYYSASEVGGDFFLISPSQDGVSNDGSLIVVVGDVSGKGLMAAMRVAMILGVLRREESRNPSEILRNLNDALQNAGSGFTTACCLRLERNGCYTLANAGHISPYIDGREIETSPALPLGLAPDQEYESIAGNLRDRQTIVLLSDGVLEAQSSSGELLGFERLAALTTQPALAIADAAREFGQEDDITVVTVTRRAVA